VAIAELMVAPPDIFAASSPGSVSVSNVEQVERNKENAA
jgi:hypothetical protein